jgi:hypothetical protein
MDSYVRRGKLVTPWRARKCLVAFVFAILSALLVHQQSLVPEQQRLLPRLLPCGALQTSLLRFFRNNTKGGSMNHALNGAMKSGLLGIVVSTTFLLFGCAGTNFVRPQLDSMALGKTTQQELVQSMGKPFRTGTVIKNGTTLETANYAYATVGGAPLYDGVTPARSQGFYYLNNVLVGTEFTSSFKEDGTDFDESKIPSIVKGKTTKADVIQMFGQPGGNYIPPLIKDPNGRALVYLYSQTKGSAFNLRFYVKTLIVSYDTAGVVTDVEYTAQGKKD